jgi:hypothetical protein
MRLLSMAAAALLAFALPAHAQAAPEQPQTASPAGVPIGLLGDDIAPRTYRLDLTIDPAKERFSGHVEIDVTLKRGAARSFHMHGSGLAMRSVSARTGGRTLTGSWTQVDDSGVARVDFPASLPAGHPVTLVFDYDAAFNDGPARLFRVEVAGEWHVWSQFQSIDARAAFPGFDQPSFKTPFAVTLRTPPGLMAVSNAPLADMTREGGMDVHRFGETLPLPTYLVAVMVGPFVSLAGEVGPTPQRAAPLPLRIVTTRQNAAKMALALDGSKQIVRLLEDYFGDGFPYPKLDQITSPIMPGAMENAGADLYQDSLLILDEASPTVQKRRFGMVAAHELAHQWFGDLVTPMWWDDIWLNESFANWMGYRIGQAWRPDLGIGAGALAEGFTAMDIDEMTAGRPIRQPIETNAQIDAAFDSITYGKGGHVVSMIAAFMGDATFRDGVRRYMKAHRNANATSQDFFAAMAEAAGDPRLIDAMRSFTDQQGVPLLTFEPAGYAWKVTQSRYVPLGAAAPQQRWGIPLCLRQGDTRVCRLLTDDKAVLPGSGTGPLVPNAGGAGYYRFELPDTGWDALIAGSAGLDEGEALAAADSLSASVRAGRGSAARLAVLAEALSVHPASHAAGAGTAELGKLVSAGLVDRKGRAGWMRFIRRTHRPLLAQLGLNPAVGAHAGDSPERAQRRAQIVDRLAGPGRDRSVRQTLVRAVDAWLAGDAAALDPQWYDSAFEVWLGAKRHAGARRLVDHALASDDQVLRSAALDAAAFSGNPATARWLLDELVDPRLRPAEKRDFLRGVMLARATSQLGYDWMRPRVAELLSGNGGIFYSARMPQWLGRFCSVARADEIARELRPAFAGQTGALELERVIDKVRNCGVLKQQRGAAISADFAKLR